MADHRGVSVQQRVILSRGQEARLAGVCAVLLAAVLGSAAVALVSGSSGTTTAAVSTPVASVAVAPVTYSGVDIVAPTPVEITFAKPKQPGPTTHAVTRLTAPRATRNLRTAPRRQAIRRTTSSCDITATPAERGTRALA